MAKRKNMAIRCPDCGAFLDCGERCDCERIRSEQRDAAQLARRRKLIAQNRMMLERAFNDYDAC